MNKNTESKLVNEYTQIFKELNTQNIDWCLIKDHTELLKNKYTNELDIVISKKSRTQFLQICTKLGWHSSNIAKANSHAIVFKFIAGIPLRIDAHIGKVLATAVPWISSEKLFNNKIKTEEIWHLLPEWELIIIIIASLRGREINQERLTRAKELKQHLPKSKFLIKKISPARFEKYYNLFIQENVTKLSIYQRLGFINLLKHYYTNIKILFARLKKPGKITILSGKNTDAISNQLNTELRKAKLSVKTTNNSFKAYFLKFICDIVIFTTKKAKKPKYMLKNALYFYLDNLNAEDKQVFQIINEIWPEKNEN